MDDDLKTAGQTGTLPENDPQIQRVLAKYASRKLGTGTLGGKDEVLLLIGDEVKRFPLVDGARWLLGRFEQTTSHPDQVDLTAYQARELGVSRFHARLHVEDEQLFLTDLASTNGTYLSGEPLVPNKPSRVRNGDYMLLGRLLIQVIFR